jgi:hypothetical protein
MAAVIMVAVCLACVRKKWFVFEQSAARKSRVLASGEAHDAFLEFRKRKKCCHFSFALDNFVIFFLHFYLHH